MILASFAWAVPVEQVVLELVPELVDHVQRQTQTTFRNVPTVVVSDAATERARRGEAWNATDAYAHYVPHEGVIEVFFDQLSDRFEPRAQLACVLTHELTHALQHQVLGDTLADADLFLVEGHAVQTASDYCEPIGMRFEPRLLAEAIRPESYAPGVSDSAHVYTWGARMVARLSDQGPWPTWLAAPIPAGVWQAARPLPQEEELLPPWPTRAEQRRLCASIGPWRSPGTQLGPGARMPHEDAADQRRDRHALRSWQCGKVQFHAVVAGDPARGLIDDSSDHGWSQERTGDGTVAALVGLRRGLRVEIPATARRPRRLLRQLQRDVPLEGFEIALQGTGERDRIAWYHSAAQRAWIVVARRHLADHPTLSSWRVVRGTRPEVGPFRLDPATQTVVVAPTFPFLPFSGERDGVVPCALTSLAAIEPLQKEPRGLDLLRLHQRWRVAAVERCDPEGAATLMLGHSWLSRWLTEHPDATHIQVLDWADRAAARWDLGSLVVDAEPGRAQLGDLPVDDPVATRDLTWGPPMTFAGRLWVWRGDVPGLEAALQRTEGAVATSVPGVWIAPATEDVILWVRLGDDALARLQLASGTAWEPLVHALRAHIAR